MKFCFIELVDFSRNCALWRRMSRELLSKLWWSRKTHSPFADCVSQSVSAEGLLNAWCSVRQARQKRVSDLKAKTPRVHAGYCEDILSWRCFGKITFSSLCVDTLFLRTIFCFSWQTFRLCANSRVYSSQMIRIIDYGCIFLASSIHSSQLTLTFRSLSFLRLHSSHSLTMRPHRIHVSSSRWDRLEEAEELDTSEEPLLRREPLMERMDLESASSSLHEETVEKRFSLKKHYGWKGHVVPGDSTLGLGETQKLK